MQKRINHSPVWDLVNITRHDNYCFILLCPDIINLLSKKQKIKQTHSMNYSSKYLFLFKMFPAGKMICSSEGFTWLERKNRTDPKIFLFSFSHSETRMVWSISQEIVIRRHSTHKYNTLSGSEANIKIVNFHLFLLFTAGTD